MRPLQLLLRNNLIYKRVSTYQQLQQPPLILLL